MEITSNEQDGGTIVAIAGRLDGATAPDFEAFCMGRIGNGVTRVVLDLSGLDYISSAGLRAILTITKRLREAEGGLAVCGLHGVVKEVFGISGFDSLIPAKSSPEEALSAF